MGTHSSILAWKIPWMEEPGGLQSTESPRVGHDWVTSLHFSTPPSTMDRSFRQKTKKEILDLNHNSVSAKKQKTKTRRCGLLPDRISHQGEPVICTAAKDTLCGQLRAQLYHAVRDEIVIVFLNQHLLRIALVSCGSTKEKLRQRSLLLTGPWGATCVFCFFMLQHTA